MKTAISAGGTVNVDSKKLRQLFDTLLDLNAPERDQALAKLASEEPNYAQALLRLCQVDASSTSAPLRQALELLKPKAPSLPEIEGYQLMHLLGIGGMGEVFLAKRSRQNVQQLVALKRWRNQLSVDMQQRLTREIETLAVLDHPNIVRWLDSGLDQQGHVWFAMEYVDGVSLLDYAKRERSTLAQRLQLFLQLLRAIEHAHQRGVIHRDLKNSNVMVNAEGKIFLLDFGIAKRIELAEVELTATQQRYFSLQAAAPEQLLGKATSTATDVYALGMLLYALLADVQAYDLSDRTMADIQHTICERLPSAPSAKAPPRMAKLLRGDLDRICLQALRKTPEERYPSAEKFRADIEAFLQGLPVWAAGQSLWYRGRKFLRRHWRSVSVLSTGALALLTLSISLLLSRSALLQAKSEAESQAQRANSINSFLLDSFAQSDPGNTQGTDVTMRQAVDRALARLADNDSADADELRYRLGEVKFALEDFAALPTLIESLEKRGNARARLHANTLAGRLAFANGDFTLAQSRFAQAKFLAPEPERFLLQLREWQARYYGGTKAETVKTVQAAIAGRTLRFDEASLVAQILASSAPDQALILLGAALQRKLLRASDYDASAALAERHRAELLRQLEKYPEALQAIARPLAFAKRVYGSDSSLAMNCQEIRGYVHFQNKNFDAAFADLSPVADWRAMRYGVNHPQAKSIRVNALTAGIKSSEYASSSRLALQQLLAQSQRSMRAVIAITLAKDALVHRQSSAALKLLTEAKQNLPNSDQRQLLVTVGFAILCDKSVGFNELVRVENQISKEFGTKLDDWLRWSTQVRSTWQQHHACQAVRVAY
jgi:serine/threonine protein kinase